MTIEKLQNFVVNLWAVTFTEIIFVTLCLILGLFLGKILISLIKKNPKETIAVNFLKSTKTLIIPLIIFIFLFTLNKVVFAYWLILDKKPVLVILFTRIILAWFAIALTKLLTSKRSGGWFIAIFIVPITVLSLFELWMPVAAYLDSINFSIGKITLSVYQLLKTVFIVIILFKVTKFITRIGEQRLRKIRHLKSSDKVLIIKVIQVITYFVILLITLDLLGINITTLAVFSGALGVGLGFGLQKVTSNFISGIIILLEKSIEVDDLVELNDGTNGIVKRTGARYMLIETSQGKEVLVPNEDFITQRVTNWTYTSHRCRIEIPINVSYDTDLELAQKVILETMRSNSRVAKTPEPACFLREFGSSSINFLLLFWIEDVVKGKYEPQSDVMFAIWKKFKEYGIQMPYPQIDVHLKK